MGQQQLLLIVLGVIVVGIAIVVGINLFQSGAVEANRNAVIADLYHVAHLAEAFHRRPTNFGGGGSSFVGFSIPPKNQTTENGTYSISSAAIGLITFRGVGTETGDDGSSKIAYTLSVTPTGSGTLIKTN